LYCILFWKKPNDLINFFLSIEFYKLMTG
jgi:hypothetical protein